MNINDFRAKAYGGGKESDKKTNASAPASSSDDIKAKKLKI